METNTQLPFPRISERPNPIERPGFKGEYVGLQTRLLLSGKEPKALIPSYQIGEILSEDLGDISTRDYGIFQKRSTHERKAYWDEQPEKDFSAQYSAWRQRTVEVVNREKHAEYRTKLQRLAGVMNQNLDESDQVDFNRFNTRTVNQLYARYLGKNARSGTHKDEGEDSRIKGFVADILSAYVEKVEGTEQVKLNWTALEADLDAIQWIAGMFGGNSKEIVAQLIAGEAKLLTQPAEFIVEAPRKANRPAMYEHEEDLLNFLNDHTPWKYIRRNREEPDAFKQPLKEKYGNAEQNEKAGRLIEDSYVREDMREYGEFLQKRFGINMIIDPQQIPIILSSRELGTNILGLPLATMRVGGGDRIIINLDGALKRIGKPHARIDSLSSYDVTELLTDLAIHEYTHVLGEMAYQYPTSQAASARLNTEDEPAFIPGKLGLMVGKPDRTHNQYQPEGGLNKYHERGRGLMEGVTQRLVLTYEQSRNNSSGVDMARRFYTAEQEMVDTLITEMMKNGVVENRSEGFRYFVNGYFKPNGLLELARAVEGKGIRRLNGEMKPEGARSRPHLFEIVYALMEAEAQPPSKTGYKLTTSVIKRTPLDFRLKSQLQKILKKSEMPHSRIQLSPAAIKILRDEFLSS